MSKEIVGLVPVKGSSDRVPMKNLRKFGNTSLLELKLSQLTKAKGFKKIIISSEQEKILQIAEKYGFQIHKRNPKYSTSDIPMSEVYSYIASEIEGENIAWINVTNPLANTEIYNNAVRLYNEIDNTYDCLLSAVNLQENVFYKGVPVNFNPSPWPRSQDLKGLCSIPFVINILKRKDMINWGSCVGKYPYFYYLNKLEAWDIDTQEDFDFCEMIYNKNL